MFIPATRYGDAIRAEHRREYPDLAPLDVDCPTCYVLPDRACLSGLEDVFPHPARVALAKENTAARRAEADLAEETANHVRSKLDSGNSIDQVVRGISPDQRDAYLSACGWVRLYPSKRSPWVLFAEGRPCQMRAAAALRLTIVNTTELQHNDPDDAA